MRLLYSPPHNHHLFPDVEPDEVYLVSYPRSGSTWLRCMLVTLLTGLAGTPKLVQALTPDAYMSYRTNTPKPLTRPLVIKTHITYQPLTSKVIYLVRDGRKVLESYYRYVQRNSSSTVFRGFTSPQDFYFRRDLWPSPWHEHVEGWLTGLETWDPDRYMVLKYEDLVRSPTKHLRDVARFIGVDASARVLRRAIRLNTKARMSEAESLAGEGGLSFVRTTLHDIEEVLAEDEIREYETIAGSALRRLGYEVRESGG